MISEKSSPQQFSPDHHFASFVSGWGVGYCLRMMKFSLVLPEKPTAYSFPFFAHVVWNCLIFVFHSFFTQMSLFGKRPHCRVLQALHSLVIAFRCRRWLKSCSQSVWQLSQLSHLRSARPDSLSCSIFLFFWIQLASHDVPLTPIQAWHARLQQI